MSSSTMINDDFDVNFLVIGAQKCGTTTLADYLREHDEICMSDVKEMHIFDKHYKKFKSKETLKQRYRKGFSTYSGQKVVGEATPRYLYKKECAKRIYQYNTNVKMVCILRNPVERYLSNYYMAKRNKNEPLSVERAYAFEIKGVKFPYLQRFLPRSKRKTLFTRLQLDKPFYLLRVFSKRNYFATGLYSEQIKRYYDYFPKSQLLILKFDDFIADHEETLDQICEFLEIEKYIKYPADKNMFPGEYEKSQEYKDQYNFMLGKYLEEIEALEELTGFDLSSWKRSLE